MDKNSNIYVFGYAVAVTLIVAVLLTFTSMKLQPLKDANELNNKKKEILSSVIPEAKQLKGEEVSTRFEEVVQQVMINSAGEIIENNEVPPIDIDLKKEKKKPLAEQRLPLFVAKVDGANNYIIPVRGSGLWDEIWGFVALDADANTIGGVTFDHAGETPGLGAEIKDNKNWKNQFVGKKIFEGDEFVSVEVVKGGVKKPDHQVDAISGATITGDGVSDMLYNDMGKYVDYLKSVK